MRQGRDRRGQEEEEREAARENEYGSFGRRHLRDEAADDFHASAGANELPRKASTGLASVLDHAKPLTIMAKALRLPMRENGRTARNTFSFRGLDDQVNFLTLLLVI